MPATCCVTTDGYPGVTPEQPVDLRRVLEGEPAVSPAVIDLRAGFHTAAAGQLAALGRLLRSAYPASSTIENLTALAPALCGMTGSTVSGDFILESQQASSSGEPPARDVEPLYGIEP